MKKIHLIFLILSFAIVNIVENSAYSHVVPQDELRNQVYLSTNEALKKVFEGVRKIKREKRKISSTQQKRVEDICHHEIKDQRVQFYTAHANDRKIYAAIRKAFANSHPVTEAKFVILIDSQGQAKDLHIMEYRGPQRTEITSRVFLDQYLNQTAESDFSAITSNQGPTPSVEALNQEVQKTLALLKVLYLEPRNRD